MIKQTKNKKYIDLGLMSAKWLSKYALHKNGGFKCLFLIFVLNFDEFLLFDFRFKVVLIFL